MCFREREGERNLRTIYMGMPHTCSFQPLRGNGGGPESNFLTNMACWTDCPSRPHARITSSTKTSPLRAVRHIRRMRGESCANLVYCSDGRYWVLKSPRNPQGTRTLVNELLASGVFRFLHIDTPRPACIEVSDQFLAENPDFNPAPKADRSLLAGVHFGSRIEVAPDHAIWDFFPDALCSRLSNVGSFVGALAVDQWLSNGDRPQAVFVQDKHLHGAGRGYTALHIDRGFTMGGSLWELDDSHLSRASGHRQAFFDSVTEQSTIDVWTAQIENFPERALYNISEAIPTEWIDDSAQYAHLLESILRRRSRAMARMNQVIHSRWNPFRHLQGRSSWAASHG